MSLRRGARTNLLAPRENEPARGNYEVTGFDLRFLDDAPMTVESVSSRADSQASLASSAAAAKKRVFPGDYQRQLPELVMVDLGDFLQTCLRVNRFPRLEGHLSATKRP